MNFQIIEDSLPKDSSGARLIAPVNSSELQLQFAYLLGHDSRQKSDNNQDVNVSSLAVFPVDNWTMVGANIVTTASDSAVVISTTDLSGYDAHEIGFLRLRGITNPAYILPTGAAFAGMYLGVGDVFEIKMKMADIALLQVKNYTPAANVTVSCTVFAMPTAQ